MFLLFRIDRYLFLSRFFKQLLLVFLIQQMAAGLFRVIAGVCRTVIIASTGGALMLLLVFLLGGFIIPKSEVLSLVENIETSVRAEKRRSHGIHFQWASRLLGS